MNGNPLPAQFTYRAFISYSHRDKAWADWLHRALETYRVPSRLVGTRTAHGILPRRLNPVFRDREELASATDLDRKVNEALAQSENLIVICSPASATSRWVNAEVLAYQRLGRGERIFCLVVAGEPAAAELAGREAKECFCPALRVRLDANGQPTPERIEPIAADARPGKDGKQNARLKLIAGMLAVGFDTLKQREQHRRVVRMTAITALALVVMAVTSVLAVLAFIARNDALAARHKAEVAQQAAQRRQKQAEDLVNFMLGDLTTKLRQVDRLDILRAVDDRAMAYFKTLPPTDVNATTLAQRAMALQRIGEVRMDQSRLPDAMTAFQQALVIDRKVVARNPADAHAQNALAEVLLWIGFNHWNQGKPDAAQAAFERSAAALERAVAVAPADNAIAHNLDNVYNNLGHVAQARGNLALADQQFRKDQSLCQRMATAHPDDVIWQNAVADAHGNLAMLALQRGHLDQAIDGYRLQQHVLREVVAKQPQDHQMQMQLLDADSILGKTLLLAGRNHEALANANAGIAIATAQLVFDSSHRGWQADEAIVLAVAARASRRMGDLATASRHIEAAVTTLRKLVLADPSNTSFRGPLAQAELTRARIALARHDRAAAKASALAAQASADKLLTTGAPKAGLTRIVAGADLLLGQLAAERGDSASAHDLRVQALQSMQGTTGPATDPRDIALTVVALLANGNTTKARSALAQLSVAGYADTDFIARLKSAGIAYAPEPAVSRRITALLSSAAKPARASGTTAR